MHGGVGDAWWCWSRMVHPTRNPEPQSTASDDERTVRAATGANTPGQDAPAHQCASGHAQRPLHSTMGHAQRDTTTELPPLRPLRSRRPQAPPAHHHKEAHVTEPELPLASGRASDFCPSSAPCHVPLSNTGPRHTQNSVRNSRIQRSTP